MVVAHACKILLYDGVSFVVGSSTVSLLLLRDDDDDSKKKKKDEKFHVWKHFFILLAKIQIL